MRPTDRLFRIIQYLRRRSQPVTADELAERLGVSRRTIYRDISELLDNAVPIRGEAGVGYVLSASYDLPPLMFEDDEVEALVFGARLVRSWADPELAEAASQLLEKVEAVLPERLRKRVDTASLYSFSGRASPALREMLGELRRSVRSQNFIKFSYTDSQDRKSTRTVRPLGLFYWGVKWTLASWCELRDDFRNFRIDRLRELEVLPEHFEHRPGQSLEDLFQRYEEGA